MKYTAWKAAFLLTVTGFFINQAAIAEENDPFAYNPNAYELDDSSDSSNSTNTDYSPYGGATLDDEFASPRKQTNQQQSTDDQSTDTYDPFANQQPRSYNQPYVQPTAYSNDPSTAVLPQSRRGLGGYEDSEFQRAVIDAPTAPTTPAQVTPDTPEQTLRHRSSTDRRLEDIEILQLLKNELMVGDVDQFCGPTGICQKNEGQTCRHAKNAASICSTICKKNEDFSSSGCATKANSKYKMDKETLTYPANPQKERAAMNTVAHLKNQLAKGRDALGPEKVDLFNAFCSDPSLAMIEDESDKGTLQKACLDFKFNGNPPPDVIAQEEPAPVAEEPEPEKPEPESPVTIVEDKEGKAAEPSEEATEESAADEGKAEEATEEPAADEGKTEEAAEEPAADEGKTEETAEEPAADDSTSEDTAEEPAADEGTSEDTAEEPAADDSTSEDTAEEPAADDSTSEDTAEEPAADESTSDDTAEEPAADDSTSEDSTTDESTSDDSGEGDKGDSDSGESALEKVKSLADTAGLGSKINLPDGFGG